jgi:hypothetical protein
MKLETLLKLLAAYLGVLVVVAAIVHLLVALRAPDPERVVISQWQRGERSARQVTPRAGAAAVLANPAKGVTTVEERISSEGRLLTSFGKTLFCVSFASGRDGIHAHYQGRDAYLTRDDLLKRKLYSVMRTFGPFPVRCGIDPEPALAALASELRTTPDELWQQGKLRRITVERTIRGQAKSPSDPPVTAERLREAALAAAAHLARNLRRDGTFRYEVDATTDEETPDYNWPRHSGATVYLAEAAGRFRNRTLLRAARLAASRLTDHATLSCGKYRCIGEGDRVDLGSAALALLAYSQLVLFKIDESLTPRVVELTEFLRSMQRPDGEFMHVYDRAKNEPVDVQYAYYTGEAALALSRAHRITKNPKDLEAARAALDLTANRRWTFFGSNYYWDSEHWTCQALADLWDRSKDWGALDFCLRWQRFNRAMQFDASNPLGEYDGGFGADPMLPPRITPAGSRSEGAVGTLEVAAKAGVDPDEIAALKNQLERSLNFMMRHQFVRGSAMHLFPNPRSATGGFVGSPTDYKMRIDFPQHCGAAMLRFMEFIEGPGKTETRAAQTEPPG